MHNWYRVLQNCGLSVYKFDVARVTARNVLRTQTELITQRPQVAIALSSQWVYIQKVLKQI